MDTKLSIALLSGLSLFLSVGAFAVSDDSSSDYLNWSYAMGDLAPAGKKDGTIPAEQNFAAPKAENRDCTVGCPGRPETDDVEPLTLTYEDEASPVIERRDFPVSQRMPEEAPNMGGHEPPMVNTQYIQTPTKVQYPIARQYPISVQYPITVQRNMTVEQPVIMQQPLIVRRPVVMQQDITVQRQPTVIQQQPVVMQQQPTFVQQQPVMIQAPAQPISPAMFPAFGYMAQPMVNQIGLQPAAPMMPYMAAQPIFQQPVPMGMMSQQYYIQGQVMAQPMYAQQPYASALQPVEAASQQDQTNY